MSRPSRNQDRALLIAGRELYPRVGCAGLTIRQVAEVAGVNPGMFHYHFKTRETFLRAVLQCVYEEMFSQLTVATAPAAATNADTLLRGALGVLGRFALANQALISRILADALAGEALARDFLRDNLPRHLAVVQGLVVAGQKSGVLRRMDQAQAVAFCAGAIAMPILMGGAIVESGIIGGAQRAKLRSALLTPEAIDERIDLALAALAAPQRRSGGSK